MSRPYVLGLTGNVATGKSTVAHMLQALGAEVVDCDHLTHELQAPGTPVNAAIARRFPGVQQADGSLDRAALAHIVFADPMALADLEALVHPAVIAETARRIAGSSAPVVVVEAIKLYEANMHTACDEVWAVAATQEAQMQRLMDRRGMDYAEAETRIAAQPDPASKMARADRVIENSGTLRHTWQQVIAGWRAIPGLPAVSAAMPLPRSLRASGSPQTKRLLLYWAGLAAFFCIWMTVNWINAGLTPAQKAAALALCVLTAGGCTWVVMRW